MIKVFLTGIFLFTGILVLGQRSNELPSQMWHEGKVVLETGDTLRGLVKYDFQQNLVQYVVNNKQAEVFTARKVLFFEIFDETVRRYRKFFTLPYTNTSNYKTPTFFELLEQGRMTLLSRDMLEYRTYNSYYTYGTYSRLVETSSYYFLKEDGAIEDFRGKRSDFVARMGNQRKAVEKYIRANKLNFDLKYDVSRITAYYNSLTGS